MKIHKSKKSCYTIEMKVLCGIWAQYGETSYAWKEVTCEKCLQRRSK